MMYDVDNGWTCAELLGKGKVVQIRRRVHDSGPAVCDGEYFYPPARPYGKAHVGWVGLDDDEVGCLLRLVTCVDEDERRARFLDLRAKMSR